MSPQDELVALVDAWRPAAKKRGKAPPKASAARRESARKLAELAGGAGAGDALLGALEQACETYPEDRDIRRAYAQALVRADRLGEAIAEFEERLQRQPDDAGDLLDVSTLYEQSGHIDIAVERLRRAVDLLVAAKDLQAAVPAARRLIELEPRSLENAADLVSLLRAHDAGLLAEGIEHLADVYRSRGKLGQEAAACCELLSLSPDRRDVRDRLSSIYTRILDVDPDDGDAWIGLAAIDEPLAEQLRVILAPAEPAAAAPEHNVTPIEQHQTYAMRKARELMDAGDMGAAALCLERVVRTNPLLRNRMLLADCYRDCHQEALATEQVLRALATAQAAGDYDGAGQALLWLSTQKPGAGRAIADAVFLNHRPESADVLYEELRSLWDEADETARRIQADASE